MSAFKINKSIDVHLLSKLIDCLHQIKKKLYIEYSICMIHNILFYICNV